MYDKPIRVLIVDDDPEDAHLAAIALRRAKWPDYQLQQATSLAEVRKILENERFDIILLDLGLSGSQGLETLDRFRELNSSIPVVVLSGLEDDEIAIQSLERDAQDYLCKFDVNARSLSRSIRHAIQRQNSVDEIRHLLGKVRESEEILQRKNDRLRKLYETAHTFVDNVSHEFRTPLTVIKEYVSLVRDGTMGPITDEQENFLTIAEDRADDLNTMVDDMLDVSKLEAGLLGTYRKTNKVHQIFDRVLPSLTRKATVREIKLVIEVDEELSEVYCDGEKVERVIINLVVNALKFAKPGGQVTLWAREIESDVIIGVTDTGPGISADNLKTIFDRFEQVNVNARSSAKGFGLGLSIAKELVELNLGRISVESELDVGSTFSFTVPKSDLIDVSKRYLKMLERTQNDFVAVVTANIDPETADQDANDVNTFMSYLVRGHDLTLRADRDRWILVLPEPVSEVEQFLERAKREIDAVSRNRPRGALPHIEWQIDGYWTDLKSATEEIVSHVNSLAKERESIGYA